MSIVQSIAALREEYQSRRLDPLDVALGTLQRAQEVDDPIWIHLLDETEVRAFVDRLSAINISDAPLWGIPFALKDNIDLAGSPTTAGCPRFAYTPERSATVVERLLQAGAIPIGKTNLDQFATGLTGTRSPYGPVRNAIDPAYIAGGSSSGSAAAVAQGIVPFALGTDTAGSGRVPAAFHGLVGFKPTRGWLSTQGVVPACQTLDCVSIFTRTITDAQSIANVAGGFQQEDAFSRSIDFAGFSADSPCFGVFPAHRLPWFGNEIYADLYRRFIVDLQVEVREVNPEPFLTVGKLLYEGPWLAERVAAVGEFMDTNPDAIFPITREVIKAGQVASAVDYFQALYKLASIQREVETYFSAVDVLIAPTVPTHFTLAEVKADPLGTNNRLGTFTNFVNLLNLCAVAIPAGETDQGLPFGITLIARAGHDHALLDTAASLLGEKVARDAHPRSGEQFLAVCGAHLSDQPLNSELASRGAWLVAQSRTSKNYRLWALPDGKRPALVRDDIGGEAIDLEIWSLPERSFGSLLTTVAPPIAVGQVELEDGREVIGFLGAVGAEVHATDITHFRGWRAYQKSRSSK